MCWVALDRASKIAGIRGDRSAEETWRATAEEIRADILEHGVKNGVLRQHYDTEALDASTLLAAVFGFLPRGDARLRVAEHARPATTTRAGIKRRFAIIAFVSEAGGTWMTGRSSAVPTGKRGMY